MVKGRNGAILAFAPETVQRFSNILLIKERRRLRSAGAALLQKRGMSNEEK